jgi:hypothetical protein
MSEIIQDFFSNLRHSIPLSSLHDPHVAKQHAGEENRGASKHHAAQGNSTEGDFSEMRCMDLGNGKLASSLHFQPTKLAALRVLRLHNNGLESVHQTTLQARLVMSRLMICDFAPEILTFCFFGIFHYFHVAGSKRPHMAGTSRQ